MKQTARERAKALVSAMTLEEAASQLCYESPAIGRLNIPAYNWWNEGLHGVARAGTATMFPQAIALAAMFDCDEMQRLAEVISTEARAKYNEQAKRGDRDIYKGLTLWSPNINIFRDPRWGRGQETYGEDPYLTARLGVAFVRGIQGEGETLRAAACAKHFAVHSGPEAIRHSFDARCSRKDMTETYLPAFEALVKEAGVAGVMGAYNRVNGEGACASDFLMEKLRQWGFDGYFVSDAWAIRDYYNGHALVDTVTEAAALALGKGCHCNCGNTYPHLMEAYAEGRVTEAQIRDAAEVLFTIRCRLGMFDEDCPFASLGLADIATKESWELSRRCARKGMVLLKNDGILPLDREKLRSIAVIGPNADSIDALRGNYYGTSQHTVTFLEGIRQAVGEDVRIYYSEGADISRNRVEHLAMADDRLAEMECMMEHADVTVICVGLNANIEGEEGDEGNAFVGGDKVSLALPEGQRVMLDRALALGRPVIVVQAVGSAINAQTARANAVLQAWYPGEAGGAALADVLFGAVSPSGKLPVTFYESAEPLPEFTDYSMAERTYRNAAGNILYPFGFGLTYSRMAMAAASYADGTVTASVRNVGEFDTEEVLQVYVRDLNSPDEVKNHRLCGFRRVFVPAGGQAEAVIVLDKNAFTVVNDAGERVPGSGHYALWTGVCQPDAYSERLSGTPCLRLEISENV